jgi:hypothetical protein
MTDHLFDPQRRRLLGASAGLAAFLCLPRSAWSSAPASPDTQSAAANLSIADFQRMNWQAVAGGQPLLQPPRFSPIIADPALVMPAQSPDQRWHLFAHSAWAIHHFSSDDGLQWHEQDIACWDAMRGFVLPADGGWWLYYEAYPAFALVRTALPEALRVPWKSWIARRFSHDLQNWGDEQIMLEASLPWQQNALGAAVGNPCVVQLADARWALYYSGGLVLIPDCGFTEPYGIGRALADTPAGPWIAEPEPLLIPDKADDALNLSAGAIKVLRTRDGYVGFQNAISWQNGHSTSAIFLLWSSDGQLWQRSEQPLLAPSSGWQRSHVYACDVRFNSQDGRWWLFYNARDDWPMDRGKEAIGALTASG